MFPSLSVSSTNYSNCPAAIRGQSLAMVTFARLSFQQLGSSVVLVKRLPLLLLVCASIIQLAGPSYCLHGSGSQINGTTNNQLSRGPRVRRQLEVLDNLLDSVTSNSPVVGRPGFQVVCPKIPERFRQYQYVYMSFHRPNDQLEDELRIDELPQGSGSWDTEAIKSMIHDFGFDLSKPTLMYTGGWSQSSKELWLQEVRKNYDNLHEGRSEVHYNLLFFDWSTLSYSVYGESVSKVPLIAERLARFFEHLRADHNYDLSKLHLVSFSLSTHIIGNAARQLAKQQRVGEIIYMDPTGVCFHDGEPWGLQYGARFDDATGTVAKHFNMYEFGAAKYIGGLDIIVNNGRNQPAMRTTSFSFKSFLRRFDMFGLSDHLRASSHENALFDPNSDCHELAYECSSYERFMFGQCGSCGKNNQSCYLVNTVGNLLMGRDLTKVSYKPNTKMFLKTGRTQFCSYDYQVIMEVKKPMVQSVRQAMTASKFSFEPSPGFRMSPQHRRGNKFTTLYSSDQPIKSFPDRIDFKQWNKVLDSLDNIQIRYLKHLSPEVRARNSAKYCPDKQTKALVKC